MLKTDILHSILDNLPDDELDLIEKTAGDSKSVVKKTENIGLSTNTKDEKPEVKEKKTGLSDLDSNAEKPGKNTPKNKVGDGTENVSLPIKNDDAPSTIEKKASSGFLSELYQIAGVDLQKIASEETEIDILHKVAEETISEMMDLEKLANDIAEITASAFVEKVSKKLN